MFLHAGFFCIFCWIEQANHSTRQEYNSCKTWPTILLIRDIWPLRSIRYDKNEDRKLRGKLSQLLIRICIDIYINHITPVLNLSITKRAQYRRDMMVEVLQIFDLIKRIWVLILRSEIILPVEMQHKRKKSATKLKFAFLILLGEASPVTSSSNRTDPEVKGQSQVFLVFLESRCLSVTMFFVIYFKCVYQWVNRYRQIEILI